MVPSPSSSFGINQLSDVCKSDGCKAISHYFNLPFLTTHEFVHLSYPGRLSGFIFGEQAVFNVLCPFSFVVPVFLLIRQSSLKSPGSKFLIGFRH